MSAWTKPGAAPKLRLQYSSGGLGRDRKEQLIVWPRCCDAGIRAAAVATITSASGAPARIAAVWLRSHASSSIGTMREGRAPIWWGYGGPAPSSARHGFLKDAKDRATALSRIERARAGSRLTINMIWITAAFAHCTSDDPGRLFAIVQVYDLAGVA